MATTTVKEETFERKNMKKKMSKAQMQLAIIKKKQCDAKALSIVEQLLEPEIDPEWLLNNLKHINKSHMEDVIEERGITKLCGYVLCNNTLTTIIDQQYHISTRKNKVYDVSRRKHFCSSRCYGACNYLLQQMLTSPLWFRDKEEIPVFKILPAKEELEKSIPGDEVQLSDTTVILTSNKKINSGTVDTKCEDRNNRTSSKSLEVSAKDENKLVNSSQVNNQNIEINNIKTLNNFEKHFTNSDEEFENIKNVFNDPKDIADSIKQCISNDSDKQIAILEKSIVLNSGTENIQNLNDVVMNKDMNEHTKSNSKNSIYIKQDVNTNNDVQQKLEKNKGKRRSEKMNKCKNVKEQSREFYNLAMHIENSVREWITEDTISLLLGEEDTKNQLLGNIIQHDRYLHLCKKLNKLQLEDEKDDYTDLAQSTLKPLPHLSVLQEEGKKMELKVRAFYKGSTIVEISETTKKEVDEDSNFVPVLPLTDAHAPKMLRRRIFLDKLNRILPDLLRALSSNKLPQYTYNSEKSALVKALVTTFSLSATNIIFKTAEWTLVGLVIIKMLSMIDPQLKFVLSSKQASMYISMILMSYKLNSNYLDGLVMELTNNVNISNIDNVINV